MLKIVSKFKTNSGYGLAEVLIGIGLLAIIAAGLSFSSISTRARTTDLTGATSCSVVANGITSSIKAYDNSLIVRNWLPRTNTSLTATQAAQDPFCNSNSGRTPVCDTFAFFANLKGHSGYVEPDRLANFQNVRGAFAWAQSLYNRYRSTGICAQDGITLTPDAMVRLLPAPLELPAWVAEYRVYLKDASIPCGTLSTEKTTRFELRIVPRYRNSNTGPLEYEACASTIGIASPIDSHPPTLSVQAVRNLDGADIPPGACSDRRTVDQIRQAGGPGTNWQSIFVDLFANEPGSVLTCRRAAAFENDPPGRFRNCPDMPIDGTLAVTPNEHTVSFNQPLQARLSLLNMRPRGPAAADTYIYEARAIDVGGNPSNLVTTSFRVHSPTCVSETLYCPNAAPASLADPQPWAFNGIFIRPYDDCLNGLCPQGTRRFCDPAIEASTCQGQVFLDDCGLPNCQGTMPASCGDPDSIDCGLPVPGTCGAACGTGRRGCAPSPPPTPPPGCDCAAVDLDALACDTFAADSCGNAGLCGPGRLNCPVPTPTPQPWTGTWGPYQCTDHSRANCNSSFPHIPSGYTRYEIDVWALAHRWDDDNNSSFISVTVNMIGLNSATYNASAGGMQLGPEEPGRHLALPAFATQRFTINTNGNAPMMTFRIYVKEGSVQVFWTVRAY
ncbi:MAG TPA: hypothetical protein VFV50_11225 [Bdellovibrionales bacterium]|nr:hypothetical protein [Bdellovibrionales bacterium]